MKRWILAVGLVLYGCVSESTDDDLEASVAAPTVPALVEFGEVGLGGAAVTRGVGIFNANAFSVEVESITIEGDPAFTLMGFSRLSSLAPQTTEEVRVRFAPTVLGPTGAELVIRAGGHEVRSRLTGVGTDPEIAVAPVVLDFGKVVIDEAKTLSVQLRATGDGGVFAIDRDLNARLCDEDTRDDFCYPQPNITVPSGETVELELTFVPRGAGRKRGSVRVETAPGAWVEIDLRGTGTDSPLDCPGHNVGTVNLGACVEHTVPCENVGVEAATIVEATLLDSARWSLAGPVPVRVLQSGEVGGIDVVFCPTALGSEGASLRVEAAYATRTSDAFAPLIGTGGGADLLMTPNRLDFGLVSTVTPGRRVLSLVNVGAEHLVLSDVAVTAPFSTTLSTASLAPGEGLEVVVELLPTGPGVVNGTLTFETNDPDQPVVEVPLTGEGVEVGPCAYTVDATLAFGEVEAQRALRRAVRVTNVGSSRCLISNVEVTSGSEFSVDATSSLWIEPGRTALVGVTFEPDLVGSAQAELTGSISSTAAPSVEVELTGTGVDRGPLLAPDELMFGALDSSCGAKVESLRFYNPLDVNLELNSVALDFGDGGFAVTALPMGLESGPVTLAPDDFVEVEVTFTATGPDGYADGLVFTGTTAGSAFVAVVGLEASSEAGLLQVARFTQVGTRAADVLYVIDSSSSTGQEQVAISSNATNILHVARGMVGDYQIGVTTMDTGADLGRLVHPAIGGMSPYGGPPQNKIVTDATAPSPAAVLESNLLRGTSGSGTERGLEPVYLALTAPTALGHNAGFLRRDAVFGVIVLTDEPDLSPRTIDFYAHFFRSLKQDANQISFTAISGDIPSGCNGPDSSAMAGPRYHEMVRRTGGSFRSICDQDYTESAMSTMRTAVGFRDNVVLTTAPNPSTLEVTIDGFVVPAVAPSGTVNWRYEDSKVWFTPFAVPEPGAEVEVRYAVACP